MNNSLVSICIPTYNGEKFLENCLDSAIGQTYRNIEIIVVDDCSIDKTYDIAKTYAAKDPRIKLFQNKKNAGLVPNWNRCMEISKGEWIKFLFQDDYLSLDCIEVMVNALSTNDKIVTSARKLILDESLDEAAKRYSINKTLTFERLGIISQVPVSISPEKISSITVQNICMNFIGEPTVVMFKKEIIAEFGTFNSDLIQICDLEYFLRIATSYGVRYIPQPLTYFRAGAHKDSASGANIAKRKFSLDYIDPITMVHQLLYDDFFGSFRKSLSWLQKVKLKLFFATRIRESYKIARETSAENKGKLELAAAKYPNIGIYKRGNLLTLIIGNIIKIRRIINK
jgi:glycosyltransferase involved in cell wall biosynthesis